MIHITFKTRFAFVTLACIFVVMATYRYLGKQLDTVPQNVAPPSVTALTPYVLKEEFVKLYTKVPAHTIKKASNGTYQYTFLKGQPAHGDYDVHNNYLITFPSEWEVYTYTNEPNRDDHGTNLVLKKGTDSLFISQQLNEGYGCVFDENNIAILGTVGNTCQYISSVENFGRHFKVYFDKDIYMNTDRVRYQVCVQDEQKVSECDPWTQYGAISFETSRYDSHTYAEFIEIIKSLQPIR